MAKRLIVIIVIFASVQLVFAQSETNLDGSVLLRHERAFGVHLHSSGWGASWSNAHFITAFKRQKLEFEVLNMRHPQEIKSINDFYKNAKSFVYGKLNYVYILRSGYGFQKTMYTKPFINGVEVRRIYSSGISMAFTKPVYLIVSVPDSFISSRENLVSERYDPTRHSAHSIIGRGAFNKGLNEISVYPGLYVKAALNFEFGKEYEIVRAIETGVVIDYYLNAIPIMAYTDPNRLFINLYVGMYFGSRFNK